MGKSKDLATGNSAAYVETSGDTMTGDLGIGGTATDASWGSATYGNREVAIDGGGGYGVLHLRGDGAGSTNTRFSMGVGDGTFYMAYDDVANVHRIKINSSGHITTPSQPAFRAYDNETVTNNGVIVFDTVNQRGGTNYSTSNGRFTCPTSGWYHFHFKYLTTSGDTRNDCSFYKNGSVYVEQRNYKSSGNHESYDVVVVDYFNANDYITCNVVYGDVYNFTTWSSWYGYLIG